MKPTILALFATLAACGEEAVAPGSTPAPASGDFTIALAFDTPVAEETRSAFERARVRWQQIIVDDRTDVSLEREDVPSGCRGPESTSLAIDDLLIVVRLEEIDGAGRVLGAAGPCVLRSTDASPVIGTMQFDSADIAALELAGRLEDVILHEMGHVLGIGTLWAPSGLLREPSVPDAEGVDTHFVGEGARAAFAALAPAYNGEPVPVENNAVPGSGDGHWRESVFGSELMSPRLSGRETSNPLSLVTIASLEDLGYEVDRSAADPFSLVGQGTLQGELMDECVLHEPEAWAHDDGSIEPME